jgi:hypothetical protein
LNNGWYRYRDAQEKLRWQLGSHKSPKQWENQILKRNWKPEDVDKLIRTGRQTPARNEVRPSHGATRFEDRVTGEFVVRDNRTGDILQLRDKTRTFPAKP